MVHSDTAQVRKVNLLNKGYHLVRHLLHQTCIDRDTVERADPVDRNCLSNLKRFATKMHVGELLNYWRQGVSSAYCLPATRLMYR